MDPESAFTRSSDAVARGNRKVFAEIGREFARFYAACLDKTTYQAEKIALYCDQLLPGEPPDGQRYLRQAFQAYYQALFEEDEKARIELLLLANLEIGFHEQTRLQPEINEALAAPVISPQEFTQNLLNALLPGQGGLAQLIWLVLRLFSKLVGFDVCSRGIRCSCPPPGATHHHRDDDDDRDALPAAAAPGRRPDRWFPACFAAAYRILICSTCWRRSTLRRTARANREQSIGGTCLTACISSRICSAATRYLRICWKRPLTPNRRLP